jgi:hypothetical protein
MTTYALGSRFWNLFWLFLMFIPIVSLAVMPVGLIVGLIGAIVHGGWPHPAKDVLLVAVLAAAWGLIVLAAFTLARSIVAIRVTSIGAVEFVRTLGRTEVPASAVRQLEGRYQRGYNNEQEWKLHIVWVGGEATVDQFHNVLDFANRIEALNPSVEITGIWPMGPPEPLKARSAVAGRGRVQ